MKIFIRSLPFHSHLNYNLRMATQSLIQKAQAEQLAAIKRAEEETKRAADLGRLIKAQEEVESLAASLGLSDQQERQVANKRPESIASQPKASARELIRQIAIDQISAHGPQKTQDIVRLVQEKGVQINAQNKIIAVSQALGSDKNAFVADRKYGWSLVKSDQQKGESPADVVATNDNGEAFKVQQSPDQGAQ